MPITNERSVDEMKRTSGPEKTPRIEPPDGASKSPNREPDDIPPRGPAGDPQSDAAEHALQDPTPPDRPKHSGR